jgi:hypothetical protein
VLRHAIFLLSGSLMSTLVDCIPFILVVVKVLFCEFFAPATNASRLDDLVKQRESMATTLRRMEVTTPPPSTREESNMVRSSDHFFYERLSPKIQSTCTAVFGGSRTFSETASSVSFPTKNTHSSALRLRLPPRHLSHDIIFFCQLAVVGCVSPP